MRTAHIAIRSPSDSLNRLREGFVAAWRGSSYGGEHFEFESPAALFRVLTPKRWELVETLQGCGPVGVRELARRLGRDVKRVHEDAHALIEVGLVEKDAAGKLLVPFGEIRADFVLRPAA